MTRILLQIEQGDKQAAEMLPLAHEELRKLAAVSAAQAAYAHGDAAGKLTLQSPNRWARIQSFHADADR